MPETERKLKEEKNPRPKKRKLPVKSSVNLAEVNRPKRNWPAFIAGLLLIAVAAGAVAKFAVLDRLQAVSDAQAAANAVQRQVGEGYAEIESYGELNDIYAHYTYSGMTQSELDLVDRIEVMELLERVVIPRTPLDSWSLSGNQIGLRIDGATLQDINLTVQELMAEEIVDFCSVNTASTANQSAAAAAEGEEFVTANIMVYLMKSEEGDLP